MKAILAILILTMTALPIDRPYNHWAFYTIKCDNSACYAQPKILYDTQHLDDALEMFRKEHHDLRYDASLEITTSQDVLVGIDQRKTAKLRQSSIIISVCHT